MVPSLPKILYPYHPARPPACCNLRQALAGEGVRTQRTKSTLGTPGPEGALLAGWLGVVSFLMLTPGGVLASLTCRQKCPSVPAFPSLPSAEASVPGVRRSSRTIYLGRVGTEELPLAFRHAALGTAVSIGVSFKEYQGAAIFWPILLGVGKVFSYQVILLRAVEACLSLPCRREGYKGFAKPAVFYSVQASAIL
ncbi:hypothetical protein BO94DRAFT_188564 [Aspergillus sclerotioniger CBS 115572]|uniref:Uncharacterized protein n=1 Tax=Aspergillus sclerotioniger CBS 115572 TaxID=1450535 RepID=A0A317W1V5_9EURO|nr:hypothetical protein BO94DRAFT_188564 [Aspergillus sclerotioniger CBS 115572]PWY78160.1 hypothetical protein BO94DRAFT_188564 [Aspergillus sclerotioniger CBS 115572]